MINVQLFVWNEYLYSTSTQIIFIQQKKIYFRNFSDMDQFPCNKIVTSLLPCHGLDTAIYSRWKFWILQQIANQTV